MKNITLIRNSNTLLRKVSNRSILKYLPLFLVLFLAPINNYGQASISVNMDSITIDIIAGDMSQQTLSLTNAGNEDLLYDITFDIEALKEVTFTKSDSSDWTLEENQDRITDSVWITRANRQGIFNIALEDAYTFGSPNGTEWAYGLTKDLSDEDYTQWVAAVGGTPPNMIGKPLSVHLISDDLYLDLIFHSWTAGGRGGGFSYTRKPANAWIDLTSYSDSILGGGNKDIQVILNASRLSSGEYTTEIIISSNDIQNPEIIVPVILNVTDGPGILVSADTLDYGIVFLGVSEPLSIDVQNNGSEDLLVSSADIDNAAFSISPSFAGLNPGESKLFTVVFSPDASADFSGTLTFNSNDPTDSEYIVELRGTGANPPIIEVSSDTIKVDLNVNDSTTKNLNIGNTGASVLNYELQFLQLASGAVGGSAGSWNLLATDGRDSQDIIVPDVKNIYGSVTSDKILIKIETYEEINTDYFDPPYIEIFLDSDQNSKTGITLLDYLNLDIGVDYYILDSEIYKWELNDFISTGEFSDFQFENGSKEIIVSFNRSLLADLNAIDFAIYAYGDIVPDPEGDIESIEFPFTVPWLSTSIPTGEIEEGTNEDHTLEFNATGIFDGDYLAKISILSNDPVQPEIDVIAALHVTGFSEYSGPENLHLGTSFVGYSDSAYLVLENLGYKGLEISNISIADNQVSTKISSFSIPPLSKDSISFILLGESEGEFSTTLTFNTNDTSTNMVSLQILSNIYEAPLMAVSLESIGVSIPESSSANESFTITNDGGYFLNYDISHMQNSYAAEFENSNGLIYFPASESLSPSSGITVSLWINVLEDISCDGNNNWRSLFSKSLVFNTYTGYDVILEEGGNLTWSLGLENGLLRYNAGSIPINEWVFTSFTYDSASNLAKIYIDGEEASGSYWEVSTGGILPNYYDLLLSTFSDLCPAGYGHVPAQIDEFRVWDRALSEEEIRFNMNRSLNGTEDGLLGYWQFEGEDPYIVYDMTNNQNNGYIAGEVPRVFTDRDSWFTVNPVYGNIASGTPSTINIAFDAAGMDIGRYETDIFIDSNDPENSVVMVPISMEVTEATGIDDQLAGYEPNSSFSNYPNPFDTETFIEYQLEEDSKVELVIFNLQGQEVQKLVNIRQKAGLYKVSWNGKTNEDLDAEAGVYLGRIVVVSADENKSVDYIKLLLIK